MQFGKLRDLSRPVIHLDIDIDVVVCIPGRIQAIRPDTLEIGRQASGPRAAYQQVAPELVIQFK